MPRLSVLPHATLCPQGAEIEAPLGETLCNILLEHGIEIEHACEKSCACTTCHVVLREGFDSLEPERKQAQTYPSFLFHPPLLPTQSWKPQKVELK